MNNKKDIIYLFFILWIISAVSMIMGAYFHEGDIQKSCRERGSSSGVTLRGDLECHPQNNDR